VILLFTESDLESTIFCNNRFGVVPLEVACLPVMKVDGLEIWVVTGVEGAIWEIELVRKYQLKFLSLIVEGGNGPSILRGVRVDEKTATNDLRNLLDG